MPFFGMTPEEEEIWWDEVFAEAGVPYTKPDPEKTFKRLMGGFDAGLAQLTLIGPAAGAELREMVYG